MFSDPIQSVLFDFENLIWLTIGVGLVIACSIRVVAARLSSRPGEATPEEVDAPLQASGERSRARGGVPVAHFTGFDLALLPLVLMKYSFSFQYLIAHGLTGGSEGAGTTEAVSTTEAASEGAVTGMTPALMLFDMTINLFLIMLVILMIQWAGQRSLDSVLGLDRFRHLGSPQQFLWPAVYILGGAAICTPIILISSNGMPDLLDRIFGEEIEEQAAVQSMRAAPDWGMRILLILNACILAPVVEELVFRGYLYGVMKKFTGAMFAAFVSGALFSVAHQNLLALLPLWGFALLLTFFYETSRCLWVPIGIHALFNAINVSLILAGVGGEPVPAGGEG